MTRAPLTPEEELGREKLRAERALRRRLARALEAPPEPLEELEAGFAPLVEYFRTHRGEH